MKNKEKRNQIIAMLYQNMDKVDAEETLKLIDDYKPTEAVKNNAVLPLVSQQRELLLAFASYVNKNELREANDQITDYSIKAFLKANNCG